MKLLALVIATSLLAFVAPGQASKLRQSDRLWISSVKKYENLFGKCVYSLFPEVGEPDSEAVETAREKTCKMLARLGNRLEANGYCLVDKGIVGRPGQYMKEHPGIRHCYVIEW